MYSETELISQNKTSCKPRIWTQIFFLLRLSTWWSLISLKYQIIFAEFKENRPCVIFFFPSKMQEFEVHEIISHGIQINSEKAF